MGSFPTWTIRWIREKMRKKPNKKEEKIRKKRKKERKEKRTLLKITELPTNVLVSKQYFLVGKPITDHLRTKLFNINFPDR